MTTEDWFMMGGVLLLLLFSVVGFLRFQSESNPADVDLKVTTLEPMTENDGIRVQLDVHRINLQEVPSRMMEYDRGAPVYVVLAENEEGVAEPVQLQPARPRVPLMLAGEIERQEHSHITVSYNLEPLQLEDGFAREREMNNRDDIYLHVRISPEGEMIPLELRVGEEGYRVR